MDGRVQARPLLHRLKREQSVAAIRVRYRIPITKASAVATGAVGMAFNASVC